MKPLIDLYFRQIKYEKINRLVLGFAVGIVWLPFLIWFFLIDRYGVNIPLSDAWHVPGMQIALYFQDKFQPSLLFEQHNESRKVIPTLIFMILSILTGEWNTRWEMFLGLAFAGIMSLLVLLLLQRTNRGHLFQNLMLVFVYNCLLLSPRAYFRWLNGYTLHRLIPDACLLFNVLIFTVQLPAATKVVLFIVSAIIAQYSFAGGIWVWLCSLFLVFALDCDSKQKKMQFRLIYVVSFGLSCTLYFWDYRTPNGSIPVRNILGFSILEIFQYNFSFLGNSLTQLETLRPAVGFGLLACFFAITFRGRRAIFSREILPWIVLGIYSIGLAALSTITRMPIGEGLSARYLIHLVYLPLAIVALATILTNRGMLPNPRKLALVATGLLLAIYLQANFNSKQLDQFAEFHYVLRQGKACIQLIDFYPLKNCPIEEIQAQEYGSYPRAGVYTLNSLGLLRPGIAKSLNFERRTEDWGTLIGWEKIPEGILFGGTAKLESRSADAIALLQEIPGQTPRILAIWRMGWDRKGWELNSNEWRGTLLQKNLSEVVDMCYLHAYGVDIENNRLLPLKRNKQMKICE